MKRRFSLTLFSAFAIAAAPGCSDDPVEAGPSGAGCTVTDLGDGTSAIHCGDGTELVVKNGKDGANGRDGAEGAAGEAGKGGADATPCTVAENGNGTHTLTCGDESVVIGSPCEGGFPGDLRVTDPGNGPDGDDFSLTLFQVTSCTHVRGNVIVDDYSGTELPKALARITEIGGKLLIGSDYGNDVLESVSFPALKKVGDELLIYENGKLTEVPDFPALEAVGVNLQIRSNAELRKVGSFPKLKTASTVDFWSNPKLETVGSFPALETAARVEFRQNPKLETIGSFDELETLSVLRWRQLDSLTDMGSFPKLASVWTFDLNQTGELTTLAEFPMLTEIKGVANDVLLIWGNKKLASIDGLKNLATVSQGVQIYTNPVLPHDDIVALFDDVDVEGDMNFCGNKGGPAC